MALREATLKDAPTMAAIYNHYVLNATATFEEREVSAQDMADRLAQVHGASFPWRVFIDDTGQLIGYAYATRWKERSAYRYSAECSVYVDAAARRRGAGSALLAELISLTRGNGLRMLIAGITLPNEQSIAVHEKLGFRKCAHFPSVGYKFDQWLDVGYWALDLFDNPAGELRVRSGEEPG